MVLNPIQARVIGHTAELAVPRCWSSHSHGDLHHVIYIIVVPLSEEHAVGEPDTTGSTFHLLQLVCRILLDKNGLQGRFRPCQGDDPTIGSVYLMIFHTHFPFRWLHRTLSHHTSTQPACTSV